MSASLSQTPLHDWHASHGGRMVEFAGWSMPVLYASIVAEHQATRNAAGLFDISHMGRLRFDGPGAAAFLERLVTRRVSDMRPGRIRYALVTNEAGGILDDVLVYHLTDSAGQAYHMLVVNAGNRVKIVEWIAPRLAAATDVRMTDVTLDWAMISVQGPQSLDLAQPLLDNSQGKTTDLAAMKYYTGCETAIAGQGGIVSRTGYTGEDGWELIVGARAAVAVWDELVAAGAVPAGLGCRDTLRLEAAMPLYGHELTETINPYQAGLEFAVDLEGRTFPGCDALARLKNERSQPRRVGLVTSGKRAPREGYAILADDERQTIGQVTSGTFSPTFDQPIAMGYIEPAFAAPGTAVAIDLRGRLEAARVVALPFYRRSVAGKPDRTGMSDRTGKPDQTGKTDRTSTGSVP
ncbi:MAG TPA: glycine cleavage system aminomethyltransferase GcvT [Pirellulales bacterium]|jgi:aminomethyltransferase|nr:glycine cleavage system aminomethyltransferase GcvT [Pirellulales bacterium]